MIPPPISTPLRQFLVGTLMGPQMKRTIAVRHRRGDSVPEIARYLERECLHAAYRAVQDIPFEAIVHTLTKRMTGHLQVVPRKDGLVR